MISKAFPVVVGVPTLFLLTAVSGTGVDSSETQAGDFPNGQEYLGQSPPGRDFVPFAPDLIPADMHTSVTVSPDGREVYWTARNGIMFTGLESGHWTAPAYLPFSGPHDQFYFDDAPVVSPDNARLFFTSFRPVPFSTGNREHIWYAERTAAGWSDPIPLPAVVNQVPGIHWQVSVSSSGTLFFGAFNEERHKIYLSRLVDGEYTAPEPLGPINEFGNVASPFISPDESFILFDRSRRHESQGFFVPDGYYVSFKGSGGQWLPPRRLDGFPERETSFVTRDGRYVFCKELWASAQIIEELRPR